MGSELVPSRYDSVDRYAPILLPSTVLLRRRTQQTGGEETYPHVGENEIQVLCFYRSLFTGYKKVLILPISCGVLVNGKRRFKLDAVSLRHQREPLPRLNPEFIAIVWSARARSDH